MDEVERISVLGIGNPLKKDEGAGVRIAEELLARYEFPDNVQVIDVGTMGLSILPLFQECDYMIVADAVDGTGHPPGTVVLMSPEDVAPNQVMHSLHDVRFADVLQTAELIGCSVHATVVGIQIEEMSLTADVDLTPPVEAALPSAVEAILGILAEHGVTPRVRDEADVRARMLESARFRMPVVPPGDEDAGAVS